MKKQIMSLAILMASVLGSATSALAQGEDFRALPKGYDDCSLEQLTDGSCVKDIGQNMMIVTEITRPQKQDVIFRLVGGDRDCRNQVKVISPSRMQVPLSDAAAFDENGQYGIVNNSWGRCQVQIQLAK